MSCAVRIEIPGVGCYRCDRLHKRVEQVLRDGGLPGALTRGALIRTSR